MIKSSFWSTILDDVVFSMNEIILGSSFILLTADADCTASASFTACGAAVLIRIWHLVVLRLWKNKPNTSKSIPFSLHGSQRGPSFHLYLHFLSQPTAATMDMMYWETGHSKILKKEIFHLHVVLSPFFPIEWPSKILPG